MRNVCGGRKREGTGAHGGTDRGADTGKRVLMLASVASMIDQFNMPNIRLLQDMGCEVHVACNFRKGNTCGAAQIRRLRRRLDRLGVRFFQWDCPRSVYAAGMCLRALWQLWRLTGEYRYDMIHCHSPVGGALARIVAHFRNIPVIYTAHGFHFYQGAPLKNWLLYYPAEKLLAYWTDVLVTVNREDYAFAVRSLPAGNIYRIPGVGIDTERFAGGEIPSGSETLPDGKQAGEGTRISGGSACGKTRYRFRRKHGIPQDAVLLLSVGELGRRKNHKAVLDAVAALDREDVWYLVCGRGKLRSRLERHAKRLGIDSRVRMAGYVEPIWEAYRAADIFVFPSYQEGLPVALAEAMASGLPCIVSDIRGNRELVGADMRFAPDAPGELAELLGRLLHDRRLCARCGAENRRRIRACDTARVQAVMKEIYRSCISTAGLGCKRNAGAVKKDRTEN